MYNFCNQRVLKGRESASKSGSDCHNTMHAAHTVDTHHLPICATIALAAPSLPPCQLARPPGQPGQNLYGRNSSATKCHAQKTLLNEMPVLGSFSNQWRATALGAWGGAQKLSLFCVEWGARRLKSSPDPSFKNTYTHTHALTCFNGCLMPEM